MARKARRATTIEEHGGEETSHHEEHRHAEDMDPQHQNPRECGAVRVFVDPNLRLVVDEGGVDDHTEEHHRGPEEIKSVEAAGSRRLRVERMPDRHRRVQAG
jgi:hypothetical protein